MELKTIGKKLTDVFLKYRYVALILVIGLALMLIPGKSEEDIQISSTPSQQIKEEEPLEDRLSQLLSQINGAGEVAVLLTKGEGEKTLYQSDTDVTDTMQRNTTVTVTDAERNQLGLIQQVNPPKYMGAVILCEGADDPTVRLSITEAVSKATGLGTNYICVLKMKGTGRHS